MFIEKWQLMSLFMVAVSAYFSYRSGFKEGVLTGIHQCLDDLARLKLISQYEHPETGEMEVGRWDDEKNSKLDKWENEDE
jgi:hypothetical protein